MNQKASGRDSTASEMDYVAGWPAAGGESCGTGFFDNRNACEVGIYHS